MVAVTVPEITSTLVSWTRATRLESVGTFILAWLPSENFPASVVKFTWFQDAGDSALIVASTVIGDTPSAKVDPDSGSRVSDSLPSTWVNVTSPVVVARMVSTLSLFLPTTETVTTATPASAAAFRNAAACPAVSACRSTETPLSSFVVGSTQVPSVVWKRTVRLSASASGLI